MQDYISTGISFRKEIIYKIDAERGDVPRSKYLQRILDRYYYQTQEPQKDKKNDDLDLSDSLAAIPGSDRSSNT
jgi:hypothetical protein